MLSAGTFGRLMIVANRSAFGECATIAHSLDRSLHPESTATRNSGARFSTRRPCKRNEPEKQDVDNRDHRQ
jgi:hypothetical protein